MFFRQWIKHWNAKIFTSTSSIDTKQNTTHRQKLYERNWKTSRYHWRLKVSKFAKGNEKKCNTKSIYRLESINNAKRFMPNDSRHDSVISTSLAETSQSVYKDGSCVVSTNENTFQSCMTPLNFNVISASFHQGDDRFNDPGIQCTFLAFRIFGLHASVEVEFINTW